MTFLFTFLVNKKKNFFYRDSLEKFDKNEITYFEKDLKEIKIHVIDMKENFDAEYHPLRINVLMSKYGK